MLYFVAVLLHPIAVFVAGKPIQAVLNVFLTLAMWVPGMIHAIFVVHNYYADKRQHRLVDELKRQSRS